MSLSSKDVYLGDPSKSHVLIGGDFQGLLDLGSVTMDYGCIITKLVHSLVYHSLGVGGNTPKAYSLDGIKGKGS